MAVNMNTMTEKLSVFDLRAELGIDQHELAKEAGVKQSGISRIENNVPVGLHFAKRVFFAINRLRKARNMPELRFDEIAWTLTRQEEK